MLDLHKPAGLSSDLRRIHSRVLEYSLHRNHFVRVLALVSATLIIASSVSGCAGSSIAAGAALGGTAGESVGTHAGRVTSNTAKYTGMVLGGAIGAIGVVAGLAYGNRGCDTEPSPNQTHPEGAPRAPGHPQQGRENAAAENADPKCPAKQPAGVQGQNQNQGQNHGPGYSGLY